MELRIIPAYAGSTRCRRSPSSAVSDHPRIRGEHRLDIPWPQAMQGSSPHTRGALRLAGERRDSGRIIPAYAGSTSIPGMKWLSGRDHPRIRGEHYLPKEADIFEGGSSPHTRGAQGSIRPCTRSTGIIPAYAGSTSLSRNCDSPRADHPRIRGEHITCAGRLRSPRGSSPHTRGALEPVGGHVDVPRIIPAYAGSTPTAPKR